LSIRPYPLVLVAFLLLNGKYSGIPEMADSIYKGIQLFKNDSADLVGKYLQEMKIHFLKRRNYFTIIERKYLVLFSA
jgi:hypothetical protein